MGGAIQVANSFINEINQIDTNNQYLVCYTKTSLANLDKTLFSNQFKTTEGKALLAYLRSITIESVAGSDITDHALRHLEGQRYIVGLIQRRVNKGLSQTTIKESKDE